MIHWLMRSVSGDNHPKDMQEFASRDIVLLVLSVEGDGHIIRYLLGIKDLKVGSSTAPSDTFHLGMLRMGSLCRTGMLCLRQFLMH